VSSLWTWVTVLSFLEPVWCKVVCRVGFVIVIEYNDIHEYSSNDGGSWGFVRASRAEGFLLKETKIESITQYMGECMREL
jgi:hypothetical protein